MLSRLVIVIFFMTAIALTLVPRSQAQTTTATISGVVTDESGGVLPGAQTTVENVETGVRRAVTTNARGLYLVPQLPPGLYQITVAMPGFETLVRTGITLTVGQQANLNLVMTVGAITQQVTVTGEAPLVNTTGSEVSGVVEERRILDLPLNGRDFTQLALVQPGILSLRNTDSIAQKGFGTRLSMAGSRPDQTAWLLDGTNIKSMSNFGTPGSASSLMLGVDAVREFQVLTSNYSAEFGGTSGGVINLVTKSGTNEFHGTAFAFHRNDNLDARDFFDIPDKPEFKRNQFGGSLGGPIKKDRTFVFGNYEGLRERLGLTNVAVVPDENARRGLIPDGKGGLEQLVVSPAVRPYLDLWPKPNGGNILDKSGNLSGLATLFAPASNSTNQDYLVARVDHHITDNQTIFSRFTFDQGQNIRPDTVPITNNPVLTRTRYATVQYENIITPQFLATSRVAYNRTNLFADVTLNIDYPANLFIFNKNVPPNFGFPGVATFGPSDRNVFGNVQNLYQIAQSFFYAQGSHSFKFGVDFQKVGLNTDGGPRDSGAFSWNSMRDFLLDNRLRSFAVKVPGSTSQRSFVQKVIGLYFQDDWNLSPKFTLNLGLRYETFTTPKEKWDRIAVVKDWVTATSFDTNVPFWRNPSKKNFSPRVGCAWDPQGNGKTAVRGGAGIFYPNLLGAYFRTPSVKNPPFAAFIETVQGNLASAVSDVDRVGPTLLSATMTPNTFMEIFQYDLDTSYEMKFNLTVERQLGGNVSVSAGYLGGRGVHLWRTADANAAPSILVDGRPFVAAGTPRLNPKTGVGTTRYSDAQSFYNGLQIEVKKRFSRGFQIQSSYTWSKTIDDATTGLALTDFLENATPQPYAPKSDRGLSALHLGQNLVINGVYLLPSPLKSGFLSYFSDGWQISSIFSASSGTAFSPRVSGRNAPDLSRSAVLQHPDLVAGRSFSSSILGDPNQYFDSSAFTLPPPGFYGNAGRNILIGPGFANLDFSLLKSTPVGIKEGSKVEFRAEFFNLFNRVNFGVPAEAQRQVFNATTRAPIAGAGKITRTIGTSRQLQFGLKLVF